MYMLIIVYHIILLRKWRFLSLEKFLSQKFFTHFLQEKDRLMTDISDNIYHETRKEEGRQENNNVGEIKRKRCIEDIRTNYL